MSEYSILWMNVKVRPEKIAELEQALRESTDEKINANFVGMSINDQGDIKLNSPMENWINTDLLAKFFAPYVYDGTIKFEGEDGSRWSYEIADGTAYHQKLIIERGDSV